MRATVFGFNPPFLTSSGRVLPFQTDIRIIKNDLRQLLLTVPGERIMRPNYGTPLRSFLFEQASSEDLEQLKDDIRAAIEALIVTGKRLIVIVLNHS